MAKHTIEVNIPDGDYCACYSGPELDRFCQFLGDSTASSAGMCHLVSDEPLLQYRGGNNEDISYYDVVKHKNCPSLMLGGKSNGKKDAR